MGQNTDDVGTAGTPPEPVWVTKTEVALRQVSAAVRMFFDGSDPVVTHSVISAGHQILTDLANRSGKKGLLRGRHVSADTIKAVNTAANFFKHADRDASERLNVQPIPELNAEFLMDAVFLVLQLTSSPPMSVRVFCSWFVSKHPDLFEDVTSIPRFSEFGIDVDDFAGISAMLMLSELADGSDTR